MMLRHNLPRRSILALAIAGCTLTAPVRAQSNAAGVIFGRALPAANQSVRVQNLDTGLIRELGVDAEGRFRAPSLPVGSYRVSLLRDGNTIDIRDNVQVSIGSGTDVSFAATGVQQLDSVQVMANALPSIDVSSVDSRTVLTAAQLQKLPLARNTTAAALLAPGAVAGDARYGNVASFGGASAAENQYYINGFSVTNPLTGLGSIGLPFDAIDQQKIYTGGYGAEYGRSTGGVVEVVTKRGGNTWKAGAITLWAPRALADSPRSIYRTDGTLYQDRSGNKNWDYEYAAYLSGPLIKDKLFFYGTADITEGNERDIGTLNTPTQVVKPSRTTRWLAKLDWNITDNHIVELTGIGDNTTSTRRVYSYDYATGTEGAYRGNERQKNNGLAGATPGGNIMIGRYTGYLTDALTVNALFGKSHSQHVDTTRSISGVNCPIISDLRQTNRPITGCGVVGAALLAPGSRDDTRSWRLDVEYRLGEHSLRAGVDNQTLESVSGSVYEGGQRWQYQTIPTEEDKRESLQASSPTLLLPAGGTDVVLRQNVVTGAKARVEQEAQYIEDHWQVSERWNAYLGLRNEQFKNFNGAGQVYVKQRHQLAPRLGLGWDVFGDSSMKLYANAGRYHLAVPSNVAIRGASASVFEKQWYSYTGVDPVTGAPTGAVPISDIQYANGADGRTPDPRSVAARNLSAYYQDEYIVGLDKQLGSDWVFGAKATFRQLKSAIDDFCDARPFQRYAERHGIDVSKADIDRCFLFNPGKANSFMVDIDGEGNYRQFDLSREDLGFAALKRKYYALDLYLEHPFNERWYGKVQYTFSRSYGNSEGLLKSDLGQLDPSVTQDWDFPEIMQGANGPLPNDRRHVIKAYGYYQLTPQWLLGANVALASGRPKNCFGLGPNDVGNYGPAYFYCDGVIAPRGSQGRLPWTYQLDLSAEYRPAFAGQKLAFTADIFNVLTQQRQLAVYERGETQSGGADPNYLRSIGYQTPRYVRLGVRYDFSL